MKYVLLFIFILSIFTECQQTRKIPSFRKQYKEIYISEFKLVYWQKLLQKGYNNSAAIREILNSDYSGFAEPILLPEDLQLIDSLTSIDNQILVIDSSEGKRRAEGAQGKRTLAYSLEKYGSKWLDSLAKKRYKLSALAKQEY